jgi:hypothetical protein
MKKLLVLSVFAIFFSLTLLAQAPPAPPLSANNSGTNGPVGGSAPIGGGIAMLLTMGAGYAVKKMIDLNKIAPL